MPALLVMTLQHLGDAGSMSASAKEAIQALDPEVRLPLELIQKFSANRHAWTGVNVLAMFLSLNQAHRLVSDEVAAADAKHSSASWLSSLREQIAKRSFEELTTPQQRVVHSFVAAADAGWVTLSGGGFAYPTQQLANLLCGRSS